MLIAEMKLMQMDWKCIMSVPIWMMTSKPFGGAFMEEKGVKKSQEILSSLSVVGNQSVAPI